MADAVLSLRERSWVLAQLGRVELIAGRPGLSLAKDALSVARLIEAGQGESPSMSVALERVLGSCFRLSCLDQHGFAERVLAERERQESLFPRATPASGLRAADAWVILSEEIFEVLTEWPGTEAHSNELIQVAAVCVSWQWSLANTQG